MIDKQSYKMNSYYFISKYVPITFMNRWVNLYLFRKGY